MSFQANSTTSGESSSPGELRPGFTLKGRALLRWVSTAVTSALLLTGCLLDRLETVKAQTCAPEEHFELVLGDSATLTFREPVLLEKDVERLLAAEPVATLSAGGLVGKRYELAKLVAQDGALQVSEATPYALEFWYLPNGKDLRLVEARMPGIFGALITPELLRQGYAQACATELAFSWRGFEQEITAEQLALVPPKAGVLDLLGPPTHSVESGEQLTYEYRWLGQENSAAKEVRLDITFDDSGEQPTRLVTRYGRVSMTADFQSALATVRFNAWGS